jgi:glycosyltransferase involved in cell wall biosynthesis
MSTVEIEHVATATNGRELTPVKLPGSLSLVLPAHNEEENIRLVVEQALEVLPAFSHKFEIIVVNDGSKDKTGAIIDELAANDSRVQTIHHKKNRGYGGALTSGFKASICDFVMFMDSDRQFDISDVGLLAPHVGKFDIVAGFRMERHDPFHRRLFAQIFNLTVRILFGVHLYDIDCAFKIFRGDLLRSMELTAPGALINTEIQAKARRQGATIEQVGVHHYPRVAGEASGGSAKVIFRAMRETIILWWRMHSYVPPTNAKKSKRPYLLGDLLIGVATFLGIPAIISFGKRLFRRN